MNPERVKIAREITGQHINICSKTSFKGSIDAVLLKLLRKYDMTLEEYYDCYREF